MAPIRFLLGILGLIVIGGRNLPHRSVLADPTTFSHLKITTVEQARIVNIARNQLGVRELTNKNDGKAVEVYLRYTGETTGSPWCAAFVSWVFGKAGYTAPRTAWSPALFPSNRLTTAIEPGNVFGIYFPELKRIAHAGIIERRENDWLITIEGNTNDNGRSQRTVGIPTAATSPQHYVGIPTEASGPQHYVGIPTEASGREGDGVYRKRRLVRSIRAFANWIPKAKKGGTP